MRYFMKNKKGQGTTEYIIVVVLIVVAIIAAWPKLRTAIETKFGDASTKIGSAQ
jgi:Flp pilus assembly pilin Flp